MSDTRWRFQFRYQDSRLKKRNRNAITKLNQHWMVKQKLKLEYDFVEINHKRCFWYSVSKSSFNHSILHRLRTPIFKYFSALSWIITNLGKAEIEFQVASFDRESLSMGSYKLLLLLFLVLNQSSKFVELSWNFNCKVKPTI